MSILQIGRAFDGIDVDVGSMTSSGKSVSFSGELSLEAVTLANRPGVAEACRDRLNALIDNPDETAVPVVWSEDPSVDGFYRVTGVSVANTTNTLTEGHLLWSVDLERVGGSVTPQIEIYGFHKARTNPHSITDTSLNSASFDPMVAVSNIALDYWAGFTSTNSFTATSDGIGLSRMSAATSFPVALISTFSVPAAYAYGGACRFSTAYGSATDQLVTGHVCPTDGTITSGWSLSNGLVRVSSYSGFVDALEVEVWDGAWEAVAGGVAWRITNGGTDRWTLSRLEILRNSPEQISIRLYSSSSFSFPANGRYWLDLTVRRGSRMVIGHVGVDAASGTFSLAPSSSVAATALTGGLRATSNDAAGNRAVWAVAGTVAVTNNTTTGSITQNSAVTSMPFMVGVERTGSSATGIETAQNTLYDYYNIKNETQRVVRR